MPPKTPKSLKTNTIAIEQRPWLPYVAPFAIFAALSYWPAGAGFGAGTLYLIKTLVAGGTLALFWPVFRHEIQWRLDGVAVGAGIAVGIVWIGLEGLYPQIGQSAFDPNVAAGNLTVAGAIGIRLFGASIIVPIMEEVFWRSFVMRFLVNSKFDRVPLGQFTWYSFGITAVAFGFEHHRWLPGIIAGIVYAGVLYRTRNLASPIQAHATTNLLLGIYVLHTGQWQYW